MTETTGEGIVRVPGEGETTSLFGDTYLVKAAGEETGGTLAVIEARLAPHSGGTPLHVNTLEDENYYVVEGTLTSRLGERTVEAPAGTFVHIPKGVYIPTGTPLPRQFSYWASPLRPVSRISSRISPSSWRQCPPARRT